MTNPIARGPGQLRIESTVAVNRAVDAQAKITGGASNYGLQSTIQSTKTAEEQRKAASALISIKNINATQAALPTLRDMKRSDEEEADDEHENPKDRRRIKRKPPMPTPGSNSF